MSCRLYVCTIPYIGATSYKIARVIRQLASVDVLMSSQPTLRTHLNASGKRVPQSKNPKGVIYQVQCSCQDSYVGETSRPINTRIKEHKTSTRKQDLRSAISEHLQQNPEHTILWDSVKSICVNKHHTSERKLLEAIMIRRIKPKLNSDLGLDIHTAYNSII